MADVFISYSRKNEHAVARLIAALEAHELEIWWDRALETNAKWPDIIHRELQACKVVIVCWSADAAGSHWVGEEANEGLRMGKYVSCLIAPGAPRIGFTTIHSENLVGWAGTADDLSFLRLLSAVGKLLGRPDLEELRAVKEAAQAREAEAARRAEEVERIRVEAAQQQEVAAKAREAEAVRRALEAEKNRVEAARREKADAVALAREGRRQAAQRGWQIARALGCAGLFGGVGFLVLSIAHFAFYLVLVIVAHAGKFDPEPILDAAAWVVVGVTILLAFIGAKIGFDHR